MVNCSYILIGREMLMQPCSHTTISNQCYPFLFHTLPLHLSCKHTHVSFWITLVTLMFISPGYCDVLKSFNRLGTCGVRTNSTLFGETDVNIIWLYIICLLWFISIPFYNYHDYVFLTQEENNTLTLGVERFTLWTYIAIG